MWPTLGIHGHAACSVGLQHCSYMVTFSLCRLCGYVAKQLHHNAACSVCVHSYVVPSMAIELCGCMVPSMRTWLSSPLCSYVAKKMFPSAAMWLHGTLCGPYQDSYWLIVLTTVRLLAFTA